MSVLRPRPPADPIVFACEAMSRGGGGDCRDTHRIAATLGPLIDQPARLLADYRLERPTSELYALLQAARRIRDRSDRVIVAAAAGEAAAARAILATCCHPFHAELPRAERGGRPRIAFTGDRFANDRDQGLLDLVAPPGRPQGDDLLDRWALIVVAGRTIPAAVAATARLFLHALAASVRGDATAVGDRLAAVGAPLTPLTEALGLPPPFPTPADAAGAGGLFSAAALLPAAIAGIDVVRLLEGAVAMNMRLDEAPSDDNPVLGLVAAWRGGGRGSPRRHRLVTDDERLACLTAWFDDVQRESMAATAIGEAPGGETTRLEVGEQRRDPLAVPPAHPWTPSGDGLPVDDQVGLSWPELASRAVVPAAATVIRLPRVDEHAVGQLAQLLLLATRMAAHDPDGRAGAATRTDARVEPV